MGSDFLCLGINHQKTPVELRERLSFSSERLNEALLQAVASEYVDEAAIVSTCNRIEIYAQGHKDFAEAALQDFVTDYHRIPAQILAPHWYCYQGQHAFTQLMRVASSLDSLVIGEPQILGQVKSAFKRAQESGTAGPKLTRVFSQAFHAAKKIRFQTELGKNPVTVSYAAVQLAEKVFGDLSSLKCLLLGRGEMGSLAASHFKEKGTQIQSVGTDFSLQQDLLEPDLLVASATTQAYLVTANALRSIMRLRRYRPLFVIDIGVPRNIDPDIVQIDGVYLYNIDDLSQVVSENLNERKGKALLAETIIRKQALAYDQDKKIRNLSSLILNLENQSRSISEEEWERLLKSNVFSADQRNRLLEFSRVLSSKLFHVAVEVLKESAK
ncbi:MAG: glutamyl-tRNA reductase [Myxococcaceae bacterium]|nr:glutamyl-tRNA reductase [Myxococcaceae bacterium]MBH2006216.1 glutamyl-tRNA reductase [Myxococcaceae bacterium]